MVNLGSYRFEVEGRLTLPGVFSKVRKELSLDHIIFLPCWVVQCCYFLTKSSLGLRMRMFFRGLRAAVRLGRRSSFRRRRWLARMDSFSFSALSLAPVTREFFNTSRFNMLSVAFVLIWGQPAIFFLPDGHLDGNPWQHGEVSLPLILIVQ